MKILLTGATGYIGKKILPVLLEQGHEIIACVRDKKRFHINDSRVAVFEVDFLNKIEISTAPAEIDAAYYLIHSMTHGIDDFGRLEEKTAKNFTQYLKHTSVKQIIYLSGLDTAENLSKHLNSRKRVYEILRDSGIPLTTLKAGIVVGSGSASFEIIRDLVEKLPVMITPKWLNTRHQPVSIRNVIQYLTGVLLNEKTYNDSFEIGGPDILTYKQMLLEYAEIRKLKRKIYVIPVLTPRLSSYWLYFVTSTSYKLAVNLVNSMKIELICREKRLEELLKIKPFSYKESVEMAFKKIRQNTAVSSGKDSFVSSVDSSEISEYLDVPENGVYTDTRKEVIKSDAENVIRNIWEIGGKRGWYYGNILWAIRGFIDKLLGGAGLNRGRSNDYELRPGDSLDYWRVLDADKEEGRLLLYAEMKLPGEAWLEFKIGRENGEQILIQKATFRPKGLGGRIYWYSVLPFHYFLFGGMIKNITQYKQ